MEWSSRLKQGNSLWMWIPTIVGRPGDGLSLLKVLIYDQSQMCHVGLHRLWIWPFALQKACCRRSADIPSIDLSLLRPRQCWARLWPSSTNV